VRYVQGHLLRKAQRRWRAVVRDRREDDDDADGDVRESRRFGARERDDDDDDDRRDDGGGGGAIEDAVRRLDRERGSVGGDDA